jgi:hypothetical protein
MASMQDCITNCLDLSLGLPCDDSALPGEGRRPRRAGAHSPPARLCIVSADFMLRRSPMHRMTCRICADICSACADDCSKLADDEAMVLCAETCRRCAQSCAEMAGADRKAA